MTTEVQDLSRLNENRFHCRLYDRAQPTAREATTFIHRKFADCYEANVRQFMPEFLTIYEGEGIRAAAGLRDIEKEPLFLEQYLDDCIENLIGKKIADQPVDRGGITEIGNLAANDCEATRYLFLHIGAYAHLNNRQWLVCNATKRVQAILRFMGLPFEAIQESDKYRIANYEEWGTYYDGKSHIMAASVEGIYQAFDEKFHDAFHHVLNLANNLEHYNERAA